MTTPGPKTRKSYDRSHSYFTSAAVMGGLSGDTPPRHLDQDFKVPELVDRGAHW